MARETIVKIELQDPSGLLTSGTHHFYPGVMSDAGYYAPARLVSGPGSPRLFEVTIPKTTAVHLFIDSDLNVTGPGGKALALRKISDTVLQGGTDTRVAVSVK